MFTKFLNLFSKRDIRFATAGSVVIKFGSAFFAFINSILLARYLGKENFGYYILAYATILIITTPTSLGLPLLITRYVSKYKANNNFSAIKGLLFLTHRYIFFAICIVYVLAVVTYFFWWQSYSSIFVETLLYGFLVFPILVFSSLRSALLRGYKYVIFAEFPDTLLRNITFTLLLLFCIFIDVKLTPQIAMLFQLIAASVGFIFGLIVLFKKIIIPIKSYKPSYFKKEWIQQTLPFTINTSIQVVKTKVLSYLLAAFGSIEAVAVFEVAMRGASLVSFTLDALNLAIAPYISSAFEKNNMLQLQRIVKKSGQIVFLFSLPVALIFILGGKPIIQFLYGNEYGGSYIPLIILCIGQLISSLIGSVGLVLNMTGNQHILSKSNVIAFILNILFSIPLILYFDSIGAAFLYSFVLILQNIYLLYFVKRKLLITTVIF